MSIRPFLLASLMLWAIVGPLWAAKPVSDSPSRKVGSVLGKSITANDIGLSTVIDPDVQFDASDSARWELMQRIVMEFGKPVSDRFVKEQKIAATADEIAQFKKTMRAQNERQLREMADRVAEIKSKLSSPDLVADAKAKLEQEQQLYQRTLSSLSETAKRETPDEIAQAFIVAWKTERDLHRAYGGRVIFQQAGPEALDARRMLYEKAEKKGDLKFDDPGVRHLFYYYSKMKHIAVDAKTLERPWFFGEGK
jgi:hypothetical protein